MILLEVEDITKHYGPEAVLDGVTFAVRPGERVGLVGPNGSGKTTLLRILAGIDEPDAGSCRRHAAVHLGYLEQQPRFEPGRTLREEAASALAGLIALEQEAVAVAEAMSEDADPAEHERLAVRYDHLQHELQRHDAYNLDHKIERVLDGLGFRRDAHNQPAESLSGGEQNRLMLAKLLLAEPNLMLLDEPSNHLDIEATEWLEGFLLESSASLVVVSHDRYFLDRVTNRTLELFRGTVDAYMGNFSAYWRQKAERVLVERRTYEKQQTEIAKTKDFIRRNAYGMKHAQAEDRRKKLARIELVTPPREIPLPPMGFPEAARSGDFVLRVRQLCKSYDRPLFANVEFDVIRGQRWALLGPNGCGKTTLLRCLLGLVPPDSGTATVGVGVDIGYFDQQLAELDQHTPAVDVIRPKHKQFETQQRRDLLARFGVVGDTALQEVGSLSGGEQCRVALARLAAADANVLVLDEPTNHLDLWARDALEQALKSFGGSVLFVSHDRYFVNQVADHLLVLGHDSPLVVDGNYDAYQQLLRAGTAATAGDAPSQPAVGKPEKSAGDGDKSGGKREKHKAGAKADKHKQGRTGEKRKSPGKGEKQTSGGKGEKPAGSKRRFPYRKVADLEDEIFCLETSIAELEKQLAEGDTYRDGDRVRHVMAQITQHKESLQKLYEHWEEATELNR